MEYKYQAGVGGIEKKNEMEVGVIKYEYQERIDGMEYKYQVGVGGIEKKNEMGVSSSFCENIVRSRLTLFSILEILFLS